MSWGIVQDMNNNFFQGLAGTTYTFTVIDETPPLVTNYAPLSNSANNNKAVNIVLTFNEYIQAGTGNIVLTPSGGNGDNTVVNIAATDTSQVSYYTTQMTLNPSSDLVDTGGKLYTITMASSTRLCSTIAKSAVSQKGGTHSGEKGGKKPLRINFPPAASSKKWIRIGLGTRSTCDKCRIGFLWDEACAPKRWLCGRRTRRGRRSRSQETASLSQLSNHCCRG